MGSPFGGNYITPLDDSFFFGAIDVLDSGTTIPGDINAGGDRYLMLSFDVINFDASSDILNIAYSQSFGSNDAIQYQLQNSDITGGGDSNFSFAVQFTLASTTQDFNITLQKESPGEWGIDNFAVDWGTPVPTPAAAWLFSSALFGLIAVSRRRKLMLN